MPASPFSVWINILGSVNPSVTRSISSVTRQLGALNTAINLTNRTLQTAFGIGASLVGIGSLVAGMKQAVDLARQDEQTQESTYILLRNQRLLRHQNVQLANDDLKALNAQAQQLQQATGLYEQIFKTGSMILATTHLNRTQIEGLQGPMANLLAYQRMQGKSAESMAQTYLAAGKAIQTGMARNLNAVGIILTPIEKRFLMMNATVGNTGANVQIIEKAINRVYAGMAKMRLGTLAGRVDLAMANMRSSMDRMGQAIRPIGQRLTIIFARLIPLIEPIVVRLANEVSQFLKDHMKDVNKWIELIRSKGIPLLQEWITKGWKMLMDAWKWFQQNSYWLVPLLKQVAYAIVIWAAWKLAVFGVVNAVKTFLNPLNWLKFALLAVASSIAMIMTNFREFKDMLKEFQQTLIGTKHLDPHNLGFGPGVMRAFPKGVVPRALPVHYGLGDMLDAFDKMMNDFFTKTIPKWWGKLTHWWDTTALPTITGWLSTVAGLIDKFLLHPVGALKDLWQAFLDTLSGQTITNLGQSMGQAGGYNPALGGGIHGGPPAGFTPSPGELQVRSTTGDVRAMTYGPHSQGATAADLRQIYGATIGGQKVRLASGRSLAVSPNLLGAYPLGSWVDEYAGGRLIRHRRVEDTSWIDAKHPTYNSIENYNDIDIGRVNLRRSKIQGPATEEEAAKAARGDINVTYNVTHHHHAGEDEGRLAAIHRQNIDRLTRNLAEVTYRRNRASFDGVRAT